MIDTPEVIETRAQLTAIIPLTIPREEIQRVMGPSLEELVGVLAEQGIEPAGPWCTHHLRMDPGIFDFEICVPVLKPVTAQGNVQPGECPAMRVARTCYHGPYSGLAGAWSELKDWIAAEGYSPARDLWARYVEGYDSGSTPDQWRTELYRPIAS